ncbi:LOW QUALITY PROTEIN: uncharacterized protein O9250_008402 [Rhynochetos jubatus]
MKRILGFGRKKVQSSPGSACLPCPAGACELRQKDLGGLHCAAATGDLAPERQALKKCGIAGRDKAERTALHLACASGLVDIVMSLIENKQELNLLDSANRSPLMKAVQCQQEECVAVLLQHGADVNLADADGNTALHLAVLSPSTSVAVLLLEHNASIDAQNKEGFTPLMLAVSLHRVEMVEFLLKEGADVHTRDQCERTPLMTAASGGKRHLIKVLLQYGADVSHKDTNGQTAADYAVTHGHSSLSEQLTDHGDWENTGAASAGGAQGITALSPPCQAGDAGLMWGAPAVDRGGMPESPNQTSRTGKSRKATDDFSQGDSIRSSEKEGSDDTWHTSEEEELDFHPREPQKPNLVLLMKAFQQFRKNNDRNGSGTESPKSPKKSVKKRPPTHRNLNKRERGELLRHDTSDASNLEEDGENDNGDDNEDYEGEEEEEEEEDLTQDEEEKEGLEDDKTQSNDILEEEQDGKTKRKGGINQKLEYFGNAECEGEAQRGTGDVSGDDRKIEEELAEKAEEPVDTPVSFIGGCSERLQENISAMSPKIMNNEVSCKSVPKQAVFQNVNNLQGTQESCNRKSVTWERFPRNADSCFADCELTDWNEEVPQPVPDSCLQEKESSFGDGFGSGSNSWSAGKNPKRKSQGPNSLVLEHVDKEDTEEEQYQVVDDKVCEVLKPENSHQVHNAGERNELVNTDPNSFSIAIKAHPSERWQWRKAAFVSFHSFLKNRNCSVGFQTMLYDVKCSELSRGLGAGGGGTICIVCLQRVAWCAVAAVVHRHLPLARRQEEVVVSRRYHDVTLGVKKPWNNAHFLGLTDGEQQSEIQTLGVSLLTSVVGAPPAEGAEEEEDTESPWDSEVLPVKDMEVSTRDVGRKLCSADLVSGCPEGLQPRCPLSVDTGLGNISTKLNVRYKLSAGVGSPQTCSYWFTARILRSGSTHSRCDCPVYRVSVCPFQEPYQGFLFLLHGGEGEYSSSAEKEETSDGIGNCGVQVCKRKYFDLRSELEEFLRREERVWLRRRDQGDEFATEMTQINCDFLFLGNHSVCTCLLKDKCILETTNFIEKPACEKQTDKAEMSHRKTLAAKEESCKLKQLFGEINETGKMTSLVEEVSEDGFREELESSHVVSSHATESSTKLESTGEFGDTKLQLCGKEPRMETVIPGLCALPDQKSLNANVKDTWSRDEEDSTNDADNTKVPLGKGEGKKVPSMEVENDENGSSRNVEGSPEYSLKHCLKPSLLDDVSNTLPKIRSISTCDENALFVTEGKLGTGSGVDGDDVPRDCLIDSNKIGEQKLTVFLQTLGNRVNENIIEEDVSSEEKSESIKMPMKGEFSLNAEVAKKGKRQTSEQKAEQQMSSSSGNHFQVLDDSTFSETSPDEGRPAAKRKSEKNKVSAQMEVTDDLDLTLSSDTSGDVEFTSTYREAMLLLEQLSVGHTGSAIMLEIQNLFLEYEQRLAREKKQCTAVWREVRRLESEKEESPLMAEETQDLKSMLAHQEVEWKSDIQSLKSTLKEEEEKRLRVERLYEKTREKLRRKEEQYCKETEEKRQLELHSRNLEMEVLALSKLLNQIEEESDETRRQLSWERRARALQEGILNNHLWRQKELEEETRTIKKNSEESDTEREKTMLFKNQLLQDEIAVLRLELDQVRLKHQEEEGKLLEENEALKEKNEDLKKELNLNEEALTQTALQYDGELNFLRTQSAVLTSKLEQTKEGKDRLEVEIGLFRSRLSSALQELERLQSSKSDVEQTLQRERDECLRLQDKLHRDLSDVRETDKSLALQLSKAENKANSLQNELHQLEQVLREKTLLLEMTQKELSQAQCQAKECDRARHLEKDQVSQFLIKQESMQERLAQLQSENLVLRQQLEDMQKEGIIKEKVVNDVQDRFNDIFHKLRADTEKQVYLVEERNKELNANCADLREQVLKYETDKVERELEKQSVLALTSKDLHSMWEEQLKSRSQLEERIAQLHREKADLLEQCEKERKQVKELEEMKCPVELRLDQEMQRNVELQKDSKRLKRLLNRAMKKLRVYEEKEMASQLDLQGEMKNRYSERVSEVDGLKTKVCELSQQLEIESRKSTQLETENGDLREELFTLRADHEKLEKSKCQLKEEVADLKHCLETNVVDHSQIEQYKRELEERAAQEITQKLQEANLFLQMQAASQDRLEEIRASHHASLRNQLTHRIRDLECELHRVTNTQQDSFFQKESVQAEAERFKELYLEEVKLRRCLANKLERATERVAEANAKLLQKHHRSESLIMSSVVSGGLAASPVPYPPELGHPGSSLALNRSLSLGGSFLRPAGDTSSSRSRVEAYVAKVRRELDGKITEELERATAELETGSAGVSPIVSTDGSSENLRVDHDPLGRAVQEYRDVLTKNYLI